MSSCDPGSGVSYASALSWSEDERELAPGGAAEVDPRPLHRRGSVPRQREVDQPRGQRVELEAEHAADVARGDAGPQQQPEQLRQVRRGPLQHLLVGGAEDRVTQGDRATGVQAEQVRRGEHSAHPLAVEHGHVLGSRCEHVDGRLHGELPHGHGRNGGARDRADMSLAGVLAACHPPAQVGVAEEAQPLPSEADEQRRHLAGVQPPGGGADRGVGLTEDGRAHDRRHGCRTHVEQPVDRVTGTGQARAHRPCHVAHAGVRGEDAPGGRRAQQRTTRGLAGADGERGRHSAQQRGVPEALTRLEHHDRLALVQKLERAAQHGVQARRRHAVLDQNGLTGLQADLPRPGHRRGELFRGELVERRLQREKCVQVLHVEPNNCVQISPGRRFEHLAT